MKRRRAAKTVLSEHNASFNYFNTRNGDAFVTSMLIAEAKPSTATNGAQDAENHLWNDHNVWNPLGKRKPPIHPSTQDWPECLSIHSIIGWVDGNGKDRQSEDSTPPSLLQQTLAARGASGFLGIWGTVRSQAGNTLINTRSALY
jgi:hypothetical protein